MDCRQPIEFLRPGLLSWCTVPFLGIPAIGLFRSRTVGNCEEKGGALVELRLSPDAAAVLVNNALADGQPHASAFKVLRPVHALENAKELAGVVHIEARAIVANEYDALAVRHRLSDFNDGAVADPAVLDGIRQAIEEYLFEQTRVGLDGPQPADSPFDYPVRAFLLQNVQRRFDQLVQVRRTARDRAPADPCQVEQIIDQTAHVPGAILYPVQ